MLCLDCVAALKGCVLFLCSLAGICWEPVDVAAAAAAELTRMLRKVPGPVPVGLAACTSCLCTLPDQRAAARLLCVG